LNGVADTSVDDRFRIKLVTPNNLKRSALFEFEMLVRQLCAVDDIFCFNFFSDAKISAVECGGFSDSPLKHVRLLITHDERGKGNTLQGH
jgi:hypothetical protein